MDLLEMKSDDEQAKQPEVLLTVQEMADEFNISYSAMLKRLYKLGVTPKVKENRTMGIPAKYSYADYIKCKEEEEENNLREKERILMEKHVSALSINEKSRVMNEYIKALREDKSTESTEAMMANAVGFISMLNERMNELHTEVKRLTDENGDLVNENTKLLKELDLQTHQMTVETYTLRVLGKKISRTEAGKVTKALHKAGFVDEGKIPSKYDLNMLATVWNTKWLDGFDWDTIKLEE